MSSSTQAPGWWLATDGNWYPPESHPDAARRLAPTPPPPPPAGWFADPMRRHEHRYWDGSRWTDHVSNGGVLASDALLPPAPNQSVVQPPSPVAAFGPPPSFRAPREDNGFVHFLRFLVAWLLMVMLIYVIVGFVWMMFAMSATGRRKRDVLMLFIPIWGTIVGVQTMWRYTAKNVYWSVRPDRVSKSLFSG